LQLKTSPTAPLFAALFVAAVSAPVAASAAPADSLPPKGPPGWEKVHAWAEGGVATPGATAVLLVHGYASSSAHLRAPHTAWNVRNIDHDPKATPQFGRGSNVAISPRAPRLNFFDELGKTFKVAVWNQVPCMTSPEMPRAACLKEDTFEVAYRTATWALRKLLDETTGPIALVGHSRGGLVGRRLVREFGNAGGRIKWFVSLHSPHQGVTTSVRVLRLDDLVGEVLSKLPKVLRIGLRDALGRVLRGGEEMALRGSKSLFASFVPGEKQVAGITYVTFGGTSTTVCRVHRRRAKKTIDFGSHPDAPETKNGVGDLLVTDASARLPWPGVPHISQPIHHFELLWHKPTIERVRAILASPQK